MPLRPPQGLLQPATPPQLKQGAPSANDGGLSGTRAPQRAPQNGSSSSGGWLGDFLQSIIDPEAKGRAATIDWLQSQGLDPSMASIYANDKDLLRRFIANRAEQNTPENALQLQKLGLEVNALQHPRTQYDFREINGNLLRTPEDGSGGAQVVYSSPSAAPMSAEARQAWGIPADDKRPYYLKGGVPEPIGGNGVNVTVGGEKAYDQAVGSGYGKRFLDLQTDAQAAGKALNALSVMEQATRQPGFYSGTGAGSVASLKRLAAALGLPGSEGIQDIESFNAMAKQSALDAMGGSLGTGFSNADRDFVVAQVPNLQNSPQGNAALIDIQRKLNTRKREIANLARDYAAKNGGRIDPGFDDYLSQWADRNPLFPPPPNAPGAGPSRVNNPNPPASVPGGARYRNRAINRQTGEIIELGRQQLGASQ